MQSPKKTRAQQRALQVIARIFSGITEKERKRMLKDAKALDLHHKKILGKNY